MEKFAMSEDGKVMVPASITVFQVRGRTIVGIVNKEAYLLRVCDSEEDAVRQLKSFSMFLND